VVGNNSSTVSSLDINLSWLSRNDSRLSAAYIYKLIIELSDTAQRSGIVFTASSPRD